MPTSSSVLAGVRFSYALPLRDSTHSPFIKFLKTRGDAAVAIFPPEHTSSANHVQVRDHACRYLMIVDLVAASTAERNYGTATAPSTKIIVRNYCLLPDLYLLLSVSLCGPPCGSFVEEILVAGGGGAVAAVCGPPPSSF